MFQKMNLHQIRYLIEHRLLPNFFYTEKEAFIGMLLNDKESLYKMADSVFRQEKVKNPYSSEQFVVESGKIDEETFMVKLTYPEPEEEPLCYCSYLFFDSSFQYPFFFTLEKGYNQPSDQVMVCAWTPNSHLNYGQCSRKDNAAFLRCLENYQNQKKENQKKENQKKENQKKGRIR